MRVELYENGRLVSATETPDIPTSLDTLGVLATLSAILNPDHVDDYARAVGLTAADLVREAQAWAVASTPSDHS